ncbi:MAG: hypothetical protein ACO1NX_04840 [Chitinophagaceae bacterium]
MKQLFILILAALFTLVFSSCNSMKDCHGVKHQRLPNGVRI